MVESPLIQIIHLPGFSVEHGFTTIVIHPPSSTLWTHVRNRALNRYKSYAATEPNVQTLSSLDLGIRLPHELRAAIDKMPDYLLRQAV